MVGGKQEKKNYQDEDIKIAVRENHAAALQAPVIAIVITSQCVEHQLFFDPFVMISIQLVKTPRIQNGFCRISRYSVNVSQSTLQRAVSATSYHTSMCVYQCLHALFIVSQKVSHLGVCVCQYGACA